MRRYAAWLLIVVMVTAGCSKAVYIPPKEVGDAEYRKTGTYRIKLEGWNEYYARRFSVTDSTVVIEELLKTDDRYKRMRHDMPIIIPLAEVESISMMETNWWVTGPILVAGGAFLGYFLFLLATFDGFE